jgi:cyclopropane fatty-acyl-phospholipid synthase-like methyltransferase
MPRSRFAATQLKQGRAEGIPVRRRVAKAAVRAWLYDRVLMGLTAGWYREVLARLPEGASLLDIGIGTGSAVARSAALVRARRIRILGLDIDPDYVTQCEKVLNRAGLSDQVTVQLRSVYDHRGGPYDAAYFSASLMLLADPVGAIKHVAAQLAPGGWVFFTQTFHHERSLLMERVKPMLHHLTTIHFGRVTYEEDFRQVLKDAGLELLEFHTMGSTKWLSYKLAVARPTLAAGSREASLDVDAVAPEPM